MKPILVADWRADCIAALADLLLGPNGPGGADLRRCLVVFPHRRPARHLMHHLATRADVPKPLFLPRMTAVDQWLPALARELDPAPLRTAGLLDRVGLLREAVAALPRPGPLRALAAAPERFFPWGRHLAGLMEELLRHGATPQDLHHLQGEVHDTAAALLERLRAIHDGYLRALDARGWTTPGLDAARVARRADELPALLAGWQVFLVGFHAPTGTEMAVLRALAEAETAQVVWHSDPALARNPARAHWACREHARWLADWHARAEPLGPAAQDTAPAVRFHEGFDLHSQLGALRAVLADPGARQGHGDTAVILPDTGALMPVLHHLPVKDVNISMGYPLARSSLLRLVETVLRLQETSPGPGRYAWREVVALIRHPYVKMLEPRPGLPLRGLLREMERAIRRGGTVFAPLDWAPDPAALPEGTLPPEADPEQALALLREALEACLTAFEGLGSLEALGRALLGLARALVPEGGEQTWHRFPVDAECLYRLTAVVVPALTDSHISRDPAGQGVLFSILRQMLAAERVPFEAEPLTGLQVLGMLESRLLRFARVCVLDATEEHLPGSPAHDPLLPDPLRALLGLPDARQRAQVAAHNFHRLVAGAREVHLFYHTGVSGSGPLGGRSVRSRFVEQLLWEEEKRLGRIVRGNDGGPLDTLALPVRPLPRPTPGLAKTPAIHARLQRLLTTRALSPSLLDDYLACPLRFFHKRLTPLREPDTVSEDGDHRELGTLVHAVLKDFLAPLRERRTNLAALDPAPLLDEFSARLEAAPFFRQMPYDLRLGLRAVGRERLRRFLASSPETTVVLLEHPVQAALAVDALDVRLEGTLDRVDRRPGGDVVLDYKTGALAPPPLSAWRDEALWERVEAWEPGRDPGLLADLHAALRGVQLPLYGWLYWQTTDILPANAAWVELRDSGAEKPLFGERMVPHERETALTELTPLAVRLLVRHMREDERFEAAPGPHCAWCPFGFSCPLPGPRPRARG
ncbi:PD-(D/E)XK nuclease family protein [Desulfocurvus vexinensis]|uniref:PD-(D/E)XK nuclease family protein n=1 Tax=Desulfocurvus vexinensis TaxID=399548 RepID=UPI0004B8410D|nr:PD-(D/E)XK nuclease family protein [Desulfocurvus vexinensis]